MPLDKWRLYMEESPALAFYINVLTNGWVGGGKDTALLCSSKPVFNWQERQSFLLSGCWFRSSVQTLKLKKALKPKPNQNPKLEPNTHNPQNSKQNHHHQLKKTPQNHKKPNKPVIKKIATQRQPPINWNL